jgi:hypothetical protein
MKLLDWIDVNKLDWNELSKNPNLIYDVILLKANFKKIDWYNLMLNPNAIHLIEKHINEHIKKFQKKNPSKKIEPCCKTLNLSDNPNAIHILEAYPEIINWTRLFTNPNAIHLLEPHVLENFEKNQKMCLTPFGGYSFQYLSENPNAIHILEANPDIINWTHLSKNPNAIHMLEKHPNRINWTWLSCNPKAIHLLEANQDKINWEWLSKNPNAIHLLEMAIQNLEKFNCKWFDSEMLIGVRDRDSVDPENEYWFDSWVALGFHGPAFSNCINGHMLSSNPNAINILKNNQDKIDWEYFSTNPSIFENDVEEFRKCVYNKAQNIYY